MTTENGAVDGGVQDANIDAETHAEVSGGAEGANTDVDQLKQELAELKKATAGKDATIGKLKEAEKQRLQAEESARLAQKTTEEKLEHYKKQVDDLHREQVLSRKLSEHGVSVEEANKILQGATAEEQADALANLIKNTKDNASTGAVEALKKDMLDKTQKQTPSTDTKTENDAFTAGMKRGAGM